MIRIIWSQLTVIGLSCETFGASPPFLHCSAGQDRPSSTNPIWNSIHTGFETVQRKSFLWKQIWSHWKNFWNFCSLQRLVEAGLSAWCTAVPPAPTWRNLSRPECRHSPALRATTKPNQTKPRRRCWCGDNGCYSDFWDLRPAPDQCLFLSFVNSEWQVLVSNWYFPPGAVRSAVNYSELFLLVIYSIELLHLLCNLHSISIVSASIFQSERSEQIRTGYWPPAAQYWTVSTCRSVVKIISISFASVINSKSSVPSY